jgi:hypothetical protein
VIQKFKIAILCTLIFTCMYSLKAQDIKEIRKSFNIEKSGEVIIDTYKGKISVEPSSGSVVDVYVRIEPDNSGFLGTSEKKQLEEVNVIIDASSNSVRLKSDYKHNEDSWFGSNTRAFVNYTIKMPKTAKLRVKDYKSDSDIAGLESNIDFDTYKGIVKIYDLTGSIKFQSYKGKVDVKFAKLTDDSRFETYKGDITVSLPKNAAFTFNSDFGKHVDFDNEFNLDIKSSSRKNKNYDISGKVNGGGPEIKITSDKGNVNLRAD